MATAVEILKVFPPSPPVPQVSIKNSPSISSLSILSLMPFTAPVISSMVSPFALNAVKKPPI